MSIFVEGIHNKQKYLKPEELAKINEALEIFFESWKNKYTREMLATLDNTPFEVPVPNPSLKLISYIKNILDEDKSQTKYKLFIFELYYKITTTIAYLYDKYREDIPTKIINYINTQNDNLKHKFYSEYNRPNKHLVLETLYELITFLFFVHFILQPHDTSKYGPESEFAKNVEDRFNKRNESFYPAGGRKLKRSKRSKRSIKKTKKNKKSKNKSRR